MLGPSLKHTNVKTELFHITKKKGCWIRLTDISLWRFISGKPYQPDTDIQPQRAAFCPEGIIRLLTGLLLLFCFFTLSLLETKLELY